MLAALTATAVSRDWPPGVFARLVSQLCDTSNISMNEQTSELFDCLTSGTIAGPLQYEYMAVLSSDHQSVVYFPILLSKFANEDWNNRQQSIKELMSYLARAAPANWVLGPDYKDTANLSSCISKLIDQALAGSDESRLLVSALTYTNVISSLSQADLSWQADIQSKLQSIRLKSVIDNPKYPFLPSSHNQAPVKVSRSEANSGAVPDVGISDSADAAILQSSRALRFLWLDWLLRTSQELNEAGLKKQLDLMWPGDRIPVVCYELCVSAFDVVAAPAAFPNAPAAPALAPSFIVKKLPLILRQITLPESRTDRPDHQSIQERSVEHGENPEVTESVSKILDGVIARLFTTMDKEVVEAVEQRHPGLRENFGIACVDLGLCDPTVLHALHRSYTMRPLLDLPTSIIDFDVTRFPSYDPDSQARIAVQIINSARGIQEPMGRHRLTQLCVQLYKNAKIADEIFVHVPVSDFLESVCVNADAASLLMEEEGCSGLIYDDLGILLGSARMLTQRYSINLPEETAPWSTKYLRTTLFPHMTQLSQDKQILMGQWVIALFSKSSGGIADELFRPFNELAEVLPALVQQAVKAFQSGVIDRDALKNGLEHFANPQMANLMAPLVLRVLYTDLLQSIHQSSIALECIVFLLQILSEKLSPNMEIAVSYVLVVAQQILNDMNTLLSSKNTLRISNKDGVNGVEDNPMVSTGSSNTEIKLVNVLSSLVTKLTQQIHVKLPSVLQRWYPQIGGKIVGSRNEDQRETATNYTKPTSSLAESARASVVALMGWQVKPQGIPAVPSVLISTKAKPILGPKIIRGIIESVCFPQSPETAISLLVADGLVARTSKLVDVGTPNSISETAQNFLTRFSKILSDHSHEVRPNVIVVAPDVPITDSSQMDIPAVTEDLTQKTQGNSVLPQSAADIPLSLSNPSTGLGLPMPFDMDMMMDESDSIQGLNFDTDFTSQPMNLEDLDSAMDFGWE